MYLNILHSFFLFYAIIGIPLSSFYLIHVHVDMYIIYMYFT